MKRPPSDAEEAFLPEAKRAKEGMENTLLLKVLQPTQPPAEPLSLATVGDFLSNEAQRVIASHGPKGLEEALQFLARAWRRSEEGGVVPTTWAGIQPLQEELQTTAVMLLIEVGSQEKIKAIIALLDTPVPAKLMTELLSAAAEDEAVPSQLLMDIAKPLKGRHLNDSRSPQFGKLIRILRSNKVYQTALVSSPCMEEIFMPTFEPKFNWRNQKGEVYMKQRPGNLLQTKSLLGWSLSPSSLDSQTIPPSQAHLTEAGAPEWQELHRATRQRVEGLQRGTQMKVNGIQNQASELVDILLRAGDAPRTAVLKWLGAVITSAEPRGKQGHVAPEGFNFWPQHGNHVVDVLGHDQTPPFERSLKNLLLVQALHAKIHGFPTSGCALNTFTLLLHLFKPIKADAAKDFTPFFLLRHDSTEVMGVWGRQDKDSRNEARFGETAQFEAAVEAAANVPAYTAALYDKSHFKNQVFWLATKGVGVLLLPVLKEAFHAMQNIAAAFHDKDRVTADIAWREYLIAEASLREGAFLERLGHLLDLTFRFLKHAAAGGGEAFPTPAPGPAWNACPSAVLENCLDVIDLYRERDRKGQNMVTGLFVYLDPEPVLTTLCVVMASDDHVRDPSLRGRAVKILHRLCISFPSWMDRLNQEPLRSHMIPCLVNVFVAVEKAIMSYYDLSYRFKYELRVPVMELFELCLQHEEHRQVLDAFVNGPGSDRFLKLLTQLINDTNSQTEEAIRTFKEYSQKKHEELHGAPAAPGGGASSSSSGGAPGGQHDEQVNEDDQTDGGEDVYRRSRMNYKEHAKKYFGLAARTWKTLWLLCKHCAKPIVQGRTLLDQLLHTSLDAQLYFLWGPQRNQMKATPQERDELGFNPKELIKNVTEIYLFLTRVNRDEVCRSIAKDERYYNPTFFDKACRFLSKNNLLSEKDVAEFEQFSKDLSLLVQQQRSVAQEVDVPEEFKCEMMDDIMSDPVQFPQSKKIVDRWAAVRQIMGSDRDPYANTPVKVEDLIALPELKEKIHRFAKDNNIGLEGGNMFD
mmetsp:Transcript_89734/g.187454  ORF Transcript_89734/g.187454 Transcript_89734/m.187454 type:complete len:1029 (-) Transcript_89734:103-3189(-)